MRKLLFLIAVLAIFSGFVMAEDLGISAGVEFGIDNVAEANDGNRDPWIDPFASYGGSYVDGTLDFFTKIAYKVNFYKGDLESVPIGLYFDIALTFNFFLSAYSTISFTAENEMDRLMMSNRPEAEDGSGLRSLFSPAINFKQVVEDAGDFYINLKFPITYLAYYKNADTAIDLKSTLGWNSTFGLGFWVREVLNLKVPEGSETGHAEIDLCLSYGNGPFYTEVEADFRKNLSENGLSITPLVQYSFIPGLKAWLKCGFDAIGIENADVVISPALGVSYSF